MFEDRRCNPDRRRSVGAGPMPTDGCRRRRERRCVASQYRPGPWWLKTNYVRELPPGAMAATSTSARDDKPD